MPRGAAAINALLTIGAMPESSRYVELDDDELVVRLGWSFRLTVPRGSVVAAQRDHGRIGGIGAHGWAGTWLVNTTSKGLVRLELDPVARALLCGLPVGVRVLRVSLAEPDDFLARLHAGTED
jgi:hypothetical protein